MPFIVARLSEEKVQMLESDLACLLARFAWLENVVVTAESLLSRLPGLPVAVNRLMERVISAAPGMKPKPVSTKNMPNASHHLIR